MSYPVSPAGMWMVTIINLSNTNAVHNYNMYMLERVYSQTAQEHQDLIAAELSIGLKPFQ